MSDDDYEDDDDWYWYDEDCIDIGVSICLNPFAIHLM